MIGDREWALYVTLAGVAIGALVTDGSPWYGYLFPAAMCLITVSGRVRYRLDRKSQSR